MFSREFRNTHSNNLTHHHAVSFTSDLTKRKVVSLLLSMGVVKFLQEDNIRTPKDMYEYNFKSYNDGRITGIPTFHTNNACCAFTKDSQRYYLFPIHKKDLENTGLTEDDLIYWLKFLNGMKAGFEYLYLGEQEGNRYMSDNFYKGYGEGRNRYYWVLVPASAAGVNYKKNYLHWIFLRYLINTTVSGNNMGDYNNRKSIYGERQRLSYYIIPRIAVMLHEDHGVAPFKALLYAHLANPFYNYYGFIASDSVAPGNDQLKADVSVTPSEFKILMYNEQLTGANQMIALCTNNLRDSNTKKLIGRDFIAPYDHMELIRRFEANDITGFLNHIKESYAAAKKVSKTERIRKTMSNAKAKAKASAHH